MGSMNNGKNTKTSMLNKLDNQREQQKNDASAWKLYILYQYQPGNRFHAFWVIQQPHLFVKVSAYLGL